MPRIGRPPEIRDKESPWILLIEFPSRLGEEFEDRLDHLAGKCTEIGQCWGKEEDGVKTFRYSYQTISLAMTRAERIAKVRGVIRVDVYDIRQEPDSGE